MEEVSTNGGEQGLQNVALLTQEDMVAFERLCTRLHELTESLKQEQVALQGTPLKDYERLPGLKGALGATDAVCNECSKNLLTLTSHLSDLRKGLTSVSLTLEEKLTSEGARSWVLESEPPETDYAKQAEQKALVAQATQARSLAGNARTEVSVLTEKAASLEAEAAQATVDSARAAEAAEAASRRADEAQKAAELKAVADAEARRKEVEMRKKKEAEEQKLKEEEERAKKELSQKSLSPEEEERRQKEAERLDPNNWPMSVYSVDAGDLDIPIGCVVRSLPGSFKRDDLEVESFSQLDDVLTLGDNEELVSHIVNLIPTSGEREVKLEVPLAIALPHVAPRNPSREVIIKKQMPNGQWVEVESYDVTIEDIKEFKFVEVRLRELVPLVALTRLRKETLTLTRKGGKLTPTVDTRIALGARPGTFRVPTDFTFEVHPVELSSVSDLKQRHPEVTEQLLSCSPIVSLLAPVRRFTKPLCVSLPVPPPPHKAKPRPSTAAPTEQKEKPSGRNAQRPASAFFGLAHKKEEELEDTLHLLTWDSNADVWVKVPDVNFNQTKNKDVATFETQEYNIVKKFLIMRTKLDITDSAVEKLAKTLELSLKHRVVQMILRQYSEDPQEITLLCAPIQKAERFQRKLAEDGYLVGPPPSNDVIVQEGQKMAIRFRGNIKDSEDVVLQFVFNSHIKTKLDFSVAEIDRFAQKGINCYRGFVQILTRGMVEQEVTKEDTKEKKIVLVEGDVLLTEMLISLPKPEPEPPKPLEKAPVSIKGEGLINEKLLRHLSAEIGDEWRRLARYLNVRRVRIQAIMRNNVNNEQEDAIFDMLLTWAKKVPHSCNKVDMLCQALSYVGRVDLVEDMRDREHDYKEDRAQVLRDSVLKKAFIKVAQNAHVTNDWKFLARQLGIPEAEILAIERDHGGLRERCLHSLMAWREREGTSATTETLLKYLRRCRYHHVIAQVKMVL